MSRLSNFIRDSMKHNGEGIIGVALLGHKLRRPAISGRHTRQRDIATLTDAFKGW
jgi:hypothetical protein